MSVPERVSAVKIIGQSGLFGTGIMLGNALIALLNLICGGALVAFVRTCPKVLEFVNLRQKDQFNVTGERIATLKRKLETERARHEAEVAILRYRHQLETCFGAILLLLKATLKKAAEHARSGRCAKICATARIGRR